MFRGIPIFLMGESKKIGQLYLYKNVLQYKQENQRIQWSWNPGINMPEICHCEMCNIALILHGTWLISHVKETGRLQI